MANDHSLIDGERLRAALHQHGAGYTPTPRQLPTVGRRTSPMVFAGTGVGVLVLAAVAVIGVTRADTGARTSPTLATSPTPAASSTPESVAKHDLNTEPVTEHDGYFFRGENVFGSVIDTGAKASRYGIEGTVVYYLTSNTQGSPTPDLEYGIAENGTRRVLDNGGYGSDASEARPGLHYASSGQGDDVVALLKGPGTVTTDTGAPVTITSFGHAGLSLVLARGNVKKFTVAGTSDSVTVSR